MPLFAGTLLISGIAMLVAVPVGLFSAIYLAEYASRETARRSSRCWRCSPASRPWSTASSPR
jgi:ABC-type phosphate transport system permease subunit